MLEASRERYFDLYDRAPVGYVTLTEQGIVVEANVTAITMLDVERKQLIDQPLARFVLKEDQDICYLLRKRLLEKGTPQACELRMLRAGETTFWARLDATATPGPDGARVCRAVITDCTERKHAEEAARRSAADLRALTAHLQVVREEERAALARELHDNFGQNLTGVHIDLMWMDRHMHAATGIDLPALRDRAAAMLPLVESLIEMTQAFSASLRLGVLDDLGLVAAIEWQAAEFSKRTSLPCEAVLPADDIELDPDQALALFRILQEALTNVIRHAQATRVEVRLRAVDGSLELEVEDDGQGFSPDLVSGPKAIGILSMRERAGAFGGTVDIVSEPGKGTTVRAQMPAAQASRGRGDSA